MKSAKSVWGRIVILLLLVISTSFGFGASSAQAGITDQINQVYQSAKAGGKDAFCRKGSVTGLDFSARSFDGTLCAVNTGFAALAEYTCNNPSVAGFAGSSCDKKAQGRLGGKDPKEVLKQEAKSATGSIKGLIDKLAPGIGA